MELKRMLLDNAAFLASTADLNIPADHVKYLDIGLQSAACATTACDIAAIMTILDEIWVNLGGEKIIQIHGIDLAVLDHIWCDIFPHMMIGAVQNRCSMSGLRLPLHVTKHGKSLSCKFIWATSLNQNVADATTQLLNVAYQYRESPFASHFNIQYRELLTTVARQEVNLDYAGAELIGILIYNSTIPVCTSTNVSAVGEVSIIVDDRVIYTENWNTMTRLHENTDTSDDAVWGIVNDNYRWLDFQQEHLPAGKLRMLIQTSGADTGHAARIIPVYVQKNQEQ